MNSEYKEWGEKLYGENSPYNNDELTAEDKFERAISDIDALYAEWGKCIKNKLTEKEKTMCEIRTFDVGDEVQVDSNITEGNGDEGWSACMYKYIGKTGTVLSIDHPDSIGVRFPDGGEWWYTNKQLTKTQTNEPEGNEK